MRVLLLPLSLVAGCGEPDPASHGRDLDRDGITQRADCDDRDPTSFPFAAERADGLDNDCDGVVDDLVLSSVARTRFTTDYRYTSNPLHASVGEVAGGPGPDLLLASPCGSFDEQCEPVLLAVSTFPSGDADPEDHASARWTGLPSYEDAQILLGREHLVIALPEALLFDDDERCLRGAVVGVPLPLAEVGDLGDASWLWGAGCGSSAGTAMAVGDFVSANATVAVWSPGNINLILTNFPREGSGWISDSPGARMRVPSWIRRLQGGDVDADGRDDLVFQTDADRDWYVASDPRGELVVDDLVRMGEDCYQEGGPPALGDLDGDGQEDLVLRGCDGAAPDGEGILVAEGPFLHDRFLRDAVPRILSKSPLFEDGLVVDDFDGDGIDDLAFAATNEFLPTYGLDRGNEPAVYLHLGPLDGVVEADDGADRRLAGDSIRQQVGRALASGDLDGDGAAELVVGTLPGGMTLEDRGPLLSVVPGVSP